MRGTSGVLPPDISLLSLYFCYALFDFLLCLGRLNSLLNMKVSDFNQKFINQTNITLLVCTIRHIHMTPIGGPGSSLQ